MTYTEFISDYISEINIGMPIYTKQISSAMSAEFNLTEKEASAAVSVALKRIIDGNKIPGLRLYRKGIYFKTAVTPFGETKINTEQLIADKYILPDNGYDTGLSVLNRLGLTSQIPNERIIATNFAKKSMRTDARLGVTIKPPKTEITAQNKKYLQLLDVLEMMDKAPVDADKPYSIIASYIRKENLKYDILLAYADLYYNSKTILHLAHTASEGG